MGNYLICKVKVVEIGKFLAVQSISNIKIGFGVSMKESQKLEKFGGRVIYTNQALSIE